MPSKTSKTHKAPNSPEKIVQAETLPVMPLRGIVAFPGMMLPLMVGRPSTVAAMERAHAEQRPVALFTQKNAAQEMPAPGDMYQVGVVADIIQFMRLPDGNVRAMADCSYRCEAIDFYDAHSDYYEVKVSISIDNLADATSEREQAMVRFIRSEFKQVAALSETIPPESVSFIDEEGSLAQLSDYAASYLDIPIEERQKVLETTDVAKRGKLVGQILARESRLLKIEKEIDSQVREGMDDNQNEYFLRERMRVIQEKLGETDSSFKEADQLRERIEKAGLGEEALQKALSEINRLEKLPPIAPEVGIIRTYVELLAELPWQKRTKDHYDLQAAREMLNQDHYALEKIKDRVLEFLAVRKLNPSSKGPILCFIGPPGVGKTSIGKSIAKALGREFVRISVGGIHDEAEIRGHRRTYIGAMPGRIIDALKRTKVKNPVFMLDEIDKIGQDFRGDPSSALLEALDPEQNNAFSDHYLEVPFDLSEVMFIATGNMLEPIPSALQDRFEVLRFAGYTEQEKKAIAKQFLIPKQLAENGIDDKKVTFTDKGLSTLTGQYTRESGVRNLEREIGSVCRKVALQVAEETWKKRVSVTPDRLVKLLGQPQYSDDLAESSDQLGVAQGMAYTEFGGTVMPIEVQLVDGKGNAKLTGNLGNVMKESCEAAMTWMRANRKELGVKKDWTEHLDAHVHVPSGAVPKDGPSAGVAVGVALASAITGRKVRREFAMTGEISLRGNVLKVGGVKEKVLAAHRASITKIILPKENQGDLDELAKDVRDSLTFELVQTLGEAIKIALRPKRKTAGKKVVDSR